MVGLRAKNWRALAVLAALALPAQAQADGSVSIADAPGGTSARTRSWTTPPRGTTPGTFRTAPGALTSPTPSAPPTAATPRWIEVPATPSAPVPAPVPAPTPAPAPESESTPTVPYVAPAPQPRRFRGRRPGWRTRGRVATRGVAPTFRFAVGDEILISIWDDDVEAGTIDLRQRILRDGTISPLWLDPIRVAGRTIAEIRGELVEAYREYYKIPRITVGVESVHVERAFVLGEVGTPSAIPLNGPQTLLQVLAQAGGVNPTLASETVRVIRSRGACRRPRVFTVNAARASCGRGRTFMVMPGDVVYVHPSGLANWSRSLTTALTPFQAFFGATGGAAATFLAFDQLSEDNNNNAGGN